MGYPTFRSYREVGQWEEEGTVEGQEEFGGACGGR